MQGEPAVLVGEYLRGTSGTPACGKSGTSGTPAFAMTEQRILLDSNLHNLDIRVYGLLACARSGQYVSLGERRMAGQLDVDRRTIRNCITRLTEAGHVKLAAETQSGMRARYELTSPLFVPKVKKSAGEPRSRRSRLSPTVRMARAFAINQDEREREIA
jgi:hypothetical protein